MFGKIKSNFTFSIYSMLSFVYGIAVASTLLSLFFMVVYLVTGSSVVVWSGIKVELEFASKEVSEVVHNQFISRLYGDLAIISTSRVNMILAATIPILVSSSITLGIFLLRKVFKNIHEGNYFIPTNKRIMYQLAFLCILVPIIVEFLKKIIVSNLANTMVQNGLIVKSQNWFIGWENLFFSQYLLLSIFFILFANVFTEGVKIKEEIDLTV